MQREQGVFVSNADTDDWEADPEVPGSDVHVSSTPTVCRRV
jgi:hypothetical protein